MAGAQYGYNFMLTIVFLVNFAVLHVDGLQCMSNSNQPVDWFIGIALPGSSKDREFMYMDSKNTNWQQSVATLNKKSQAVYFTFDSLQQQSKTDTMYIYYNDEPPGCVHPDNNRGHTKGVIGFDKQSGFWLVHSIPRFPVKYKNYQYPNSRFAQSFLCLSTNNMDDVAHQLLYNCPQIYYKNVPNYFIEKSDSLKSLTEDKCVAGGEYRKTLLKSIEGVEFTSFAKTSSWNKDLYADLIAPSFEDSLFVQTWQNGQGVKMPSFCTKPYQVMNIKAIKFTPSIQFQTTSDHSKWAISKSAEAAWVCVGDINRMESQKKRAGGSVCLKNQGVWNSFYSIIANTEECEKTEKDFHVNGAVLLKTEKSHKYRKEMSVKDIENKEYNY